MTDTKTGSCGKFIVGGEYAVLEGAPCIAYPLSNLRLKLVDAEKANVELSEEQKTNFIAVAERIGLWISEDQLPQIYSEIPLGAGFGSSAALCVELAKRLSPQVDKFHRFEIARKAEDFFHGRSSGVDPACIAYEAPIVFQNQPISIENLELHQNFEGYYWLLRDSQSRHKTSEGIKSCMAHQRWGEAVVGIREAVNQMIQALKDGDTEALIEALRSNAQSLKLLPCHTPEIQSTCDELEAMGAKATKLSGGGFGGYVLGLMDRATLEKNRGLLKRSDLVISLLGHDETREWI